MSPSSVGTAAGCLPVLSGPQPGVSQFCRGRSRVSRSSVWAAARCLQVSLTTQTPTRETSWTTMKFICSTSVGESGHRAPHLRLAPPCICTIIFAMRRTVRYIVVKNVLTAKEVAAAHAAVERNLEKAVISKHRKGIQRVPDGTVLGDTSRWDLRGMLGWEAEDRRPFVKMLAHPKLTRYVNTICGKGFRSACSTHQQTIGASSRHHLKIIAAGWIMRRRSLRRLRARLPVACMGRLVQGSIQRPTMSGKMVQWCVPPPHAHSLIHGFGLKNCLVCLSFPQQSAQRSRRRFVPARGLS
eukprot:SAG31_NODE_239_length_19453_cov_5.539888_17_plen_298_part_00